MLSRNQIKYYSSLRQKKFRKQYKRFLAEGEKIVKELIQNPGEWLKPVRLLAEKDFLDDFDPSALSIPVTEVNTKELERISSLDSANRAILELEIPEEKLLFEEINKGLSLFYEDIRDPGNLGTIIRTADWFGIRNIFCTDTSVDPYNPKVIQSSMGSFARVRVHHVNVQEFLSFFDAELKGLSKIVTLIRGDNIYETRLPEQAVIFFGNESRGLSDAIIEAADQKVSIPSFPGTGAESLNVGISTAIICSELRRRRAD